ncbi:glycosyltransferase family 9 protein [Phaeospirillum tilakii]|uniref:Glycosyltransferase family 9 protein n=1 Tax=Phaeospirillum tilakii TaxID=741673 RepID=A0ABW5CD46_9PROT
MRILLIRMMGLGDVAAILVPAARLIRRRFPAARIEAMTFAAGIEVMARVAEIDAVLPVSAAQWPDSLPEAMRSAAALAAEIAGRGYDRVINFDTWFFPGFLARLVMEAGVPVEGNYARLPTRVFLDQLAAGRLTQAYFGDQGGHAASTFPHMADWVMPWWDRFPDWPSYPHFFLGHCCGLAGDLDFDLPATPDPALRAAAGGRPVVALSLAGRKLRYRDGGRLALALEQAGCHVWSGFDGSVPIATTLDRLKATDLLISLPTSSQWLARAVGCPTLLVPGSQPPRHLGAEAVAAPVIECQYCGLMTCPRGLDFPCLAVPPEALVAQVRALLA